MPFAGLFAVSVAQDAAPIPNGALNFHNVQNKRYFSAIASPFACGSRECLRTCKTLIQVFNADAIPKRRRKTKQNSALLMNDCW
ncbi:MAG: hypothetical protein ABI308_16070 [Mucilaginibacter sp.]